MDGLLVMPAAPSLPPTVLDGIEAPPDGTAPLGAETPLWTPEFPLADALAMLAEELADAEADEMIEEWTADASATGQTVYRSIVSLLFSQKYHFIKRTVVRAMTSVTTTPAEAELRAGQLVTVAAQLVMVWI